MDKRIPFYFATWCGPSGFRHRNGENRACSTQEENRIDYRLRGLRVRCFSTKSHHSNSRVESFVNYLSLEYTRWYFHSSREMTVPRRATSVDRILHVNTSPDNVVFVKFSVYYICSFALFQKCFRGNEKMVVCFSGWQVFFQRQLSSFTAEKSSISLNQSPQKIKHMHIISPRNHFFSVEICGGYLRIHWWNLGSRERGLWYRLSHPCTFKRRFLLWNTL